MTYIYEVWNAEPYEGFSLAFTTAATEAVRYAENHLKERPYLSPLEVRRHRQIGDWEGMNDDLPDVVWRSGEGWTGV